MNKYSKLLLITLIVLLSFGLTSKFYFWKDDSALIYKLQHIEESPDSFGPGYFGSGPYKYLATPFIPFFTIFNLNPSGYFTIGIFIYLITTLCFYFFSKQLFRENRLPLWGTLIFGSSYISTESMQRMINSWQTNIGAAISLLSFGFYLKSKNCETLKQRVLNYILSFIFFISSIEFVYIRSHSILFVIIGIELINLIGNKKLIKSILFGLVKIIPFTIYFYLRYLSGGTEASSSLGPYIKNIIQGNFEVLIGHIGTLGNIFIPDILQRLFTNKFTISSLANFNIILAILIITILIILKINKKRYYLSALLIPFTANALNKFFILKNLHWYSDLISHLSGQIGFVSLGFLLTIVVLHYKKEIKLSQIIILGLIILSTQIVGYNANNPYTIFKTTERYLVHSLIGYSIIVSAFSYIIYKKNKRIGLLLLVGFIGSGVFLNIFTQYKLIKNRAIPVSNFYNQLTSHIKEISEPIVVYIDIIDKPQARQIIADAFSVGTMPNSTAIAIKYQTTPYNIYTPDNYNELLFLVSSKKVKPQNIYTFFYDGKNLIDTSKNIREISSNNVNKEGFSIAAPTIVEFKGRIKLDEVKINYPFTEEGIKNPLDITHGEKISFLDYLSSRIDFYKTASITTLSSWPRQESVYALDNDPNTTWWGHRIEWNDKKYESLTIDLGKTKIINRLSWINWHRNLSPMKYKISTSLDNNSFNLVKDVTKTYPYDTNQRVIDSFKETKARFIKIDFYSTFTEDAPSISEIEAIESKYQKIDIEKALIYQSNLFQNIQNKDEFDQILERSANLLQIVISWTTDKENGVNKINVPIYNLDSNSLYSIILPPGGTKILNMDIYPQNNFLNLEIKTKKIFNPSIDNLLEKNYIKEVVN